MINYRTFQKKPIVAFSVSRSAIFFAEFQILNRLLRLIPGGKAEKLESSSEFKRAIRVSILKLYEKDADRILRKIYPLSVLKPESPMAHLRRIPLLARDGFSLYRRRAQGKTAVFDSGARNQFDDVPRYFRRNFHFQTNGYLSEESAEIYDHQVDLLFSGATQAMRRLLLEPMKDHFDANSIGRPKILELAAGAGSATIFTKRAFPKAFVTVNDLSGPYLKAARKNLASFDRIDFVQGDAAQLSFKDETFDAVYSVFLFHELPEIERRNVIREALRVLKPGGFFGIIDSLQKDDVPEFNVALERFPENYHEPFFRNYTEHPLETVLEEEGVEAVMREFGFFSKAIWGRKKPRPSSQPEGSD